MKKFTLLVFTLFALCSLDLNLSAGALDLPLNATTPQRTVRAALTELAENLKPHTLFGIWQFEEAALVLIPNFLKTKLKENRSKLTPSQIAQTQEIIDELEVFASCTVLAAPLAQTQAPKARRITKKMITILPAIKAISGTIEEIPNILLEAIDMRLAGFENPGTLLSYHDLVCWIENKCDSPVNPDLFDDLDDSDSLETLREGLTVALGKLVTSPSPKPLTNDDLKTAEKIYVFLGNPDKHWDLWELGAVQAAVDDILAFVKLPKDPESPIGVSEL